MAAQATTVKWSGQTTECGPRLSGGRPDVSHMRKDGMSMHEFADVTYEVQDGLAWITINRPERYNSFRARTVDELVSALNDCLSTLSAVGESFRISSAQARTSLRSWSAGTTLLARPHSKAC